MLNFSAKIAWCIQGINAQKKVREQAPLSIEQVSTSLPVLESELNLSAQDEEEPEGLGDSDDEIPCYSDIEMMVSVTIL